MENGEVKIIETRSFRPPTPKSLTSSEMITTYRDALRNGRQQAALELSSARNRAKTSVKLVTRNDHLDSRRAIRRVLNDPFETYSPLFRYALASQMIKEPPESEEDVRCNESFRDFVRKYAPHAYIQYYGNPKGYSQWGKWLPKGFAQAARYFYRRLIATSNDAE